MLTKLINVGKIKKIKVEVPESLKELRLFVSDEKDLLYLANRGLDQVRRTLLLANAKRGKGRAYVQALAEHYHYHRGTKMNGEILQ